MAERRRWVILGIGVFAQASTCSFVYGMPMLIPALRSAEQLTLFQSGLVISAPILGLLLTLIAWGVAADRRGERSVIALGVAIAAIALAATYFVHGVVPIGLLLVVAGAGAASVNAASGRMIMGWFAKNERGLAMGIRQTAQPVGVAIAALALPPLASHYGIHAALLFPAALCALSAVSVWLWVIDPPRPAASDGQFARISPYRGSTNLLRVHLASSLLVVPQFTVASFTLVYLVEQQSWNATVAGRVVFVFQLAGALGRIVTGIWSDRVDSRLRPMRQLAATAAALMLLLALGAWLQTWWIVIVFGISAIVTVADNGLAFTSVAEIAGPHWAGRALGVHNTIQNVVSIACAPLLAVVISNTNYAWAFGIVAISPILAILVTPVRAERREPNTVSR